MSTFGNSTGTSVFGGLGNDALAKQINEKKSSIGSSIVVGAGCVGSMVSILGVGSARILPLLEGAFGANAGLVGAGGIAVLAALGVGNLLMAGRNMGIASMMKQEMKSVTARNRNSSFSHVQERPVASASNTWGFWQKS